MGSDNLAKELADTAKEYLESLKIPGTSKVNTTSTPSSRALLPLKPKPLSSL